MILLSILAVAVAAVPTLGGYGVAVLVRGRRRRDRVLRGLAAVAAAVTIAVYSWGALAMLQDETAATEACQQAVGPTHAGDVAGYEISFVPLRFGCRVDGVGTYEAFVPGFVNPTALVLVLVTAVLVGLARQDAPVTPFSTTGGTTS